MYIYVFAIILISAAILMGAMTRGFRKGFSAQFNTALSLAAAILVVYQLAKLLGEWKQSEFSGMIIGLILLLLTALIWKLVSLGLKAIDLISKLPLFNWLDSALGLIFGLIEGFLVLYLLEFILRGYILT